MKLISNLILTVVTILAAVPVLYLTFMAVAMIVLIRMGY